MLIGGRILNIGGGMRQLGLKLRSKEWRWLRERIKRYVRSITKRSDIV